MCLDSSYASGFVQRRPNPALTRICSHTGGGKKKTKDEMLNRSRIKPVLNLIQYLGHGSG